MCLGIPGRVVAMVDGYADQLALVDVVGKVRNINVGMLESPVTPDDWVLIHMGSRSGSSMRRRPTKRYPGWK